MLACRGRAARVGSRAPGAGPIGCGYSGYGSPNANAGSPEVKEPRAEAAASGRLHMHIYYCICIVSRLGQASHGSGRTQSSMEGAAATAQGT